MPPGSSEPTSPPKTFEELSPNLSSHISWLPTPLLFFSISQQHNLGGKVCKGQTAFQWWRGWRNWVSKIKALSKEQGGGDGLQQSYMNSFAPFKSRRVLTGDYVICYIIVFFFCGQQENIQVLASWKAMLQLKGPFVFMATGNPLLAGSCACTGH